MPKNQSSLSDSQDNGNKPYLCYSRTRDLALLNPACVTHLPHYQEGMGIRELLYKLVYASNLGLVTEGQLWPTVRGAYPGLYPLASRGSHLTLCCDRNADTTLANHGHRSLIHFSFKEVTVNSRGVIMYYGFKGPHAQGSR